MTSPDDFRYDVVVDGDEIDSFASEKEAIECFESIKNDPTCRYKYLTVLKCTEDTVLLTIIDDERN